MQIACLPVQQLCQIQRLLPQRLEPGPSVPLKEQTLLVVPAYRWIWPLNPAAGHRAPQQEAESRAPSHRALSGEADASKAAPLELQGTSFIPHSLELCAPAAAQRTRERVGREGKALRQRLQLTERLTR